MKLVVFEILSKTAKIEKFLGAGWRVVASYGHVRDLPPSALGVDVENSRSNTSIIVPQGDAKRNHSERNEESPICRLETLHFVQSDKSRMKFQINLNYYASIAIAGRKRL